MQDLGFPCAKKVTFTKKSASKKSRCASLGTHKKILIQSGSSTLLHSHTQLGATKASWRLWKRVKFNHRIANIFTHNDNWLCMRGLDKNPFQFCKANIKQKAKRILNWGEGNLSEWICDRAWQHESLTFSRPVREWREWDVWPPERGCYVQRSCRPCRICGRNDTYPAAPSSSPLHLCTPGTHSTKCSHRLMGIEGSIWSVPPSKMNGAVRTWEKLERNILICVITSSKEIFSLNWN